MPSPGQTLKPLVLLGRDPADCWQYLGAKTSDGYGKKTVGDRTVSAGRWIWETLFGPLPAGLVVSTTCGTHGCLNPHHLRACTQADANRAGVGATLLPGDVVEIKRAKKLRTLGTATALAQRYGCSKREIFDIWGGRALGEPGTRNKKAVA